MPWWPLTWPSLPLFDFALPANIQQRFLSYVLKQAIGRFLKTGQVDAQQIDSQIGSGSIQIRDLEISHDAVNSMLSGLPVELRDATIGSMAMRIPWSNLLSGSVRLSLASVHLVFYLAPPADNAATTPSDLAESAVNIAETFIHDELSAEDEENLRRSIRIENDTAINQLPTNVPGGFDAFEQPSFPVSNPQISTDPTGISLFATLFQRLLLRFELSIVDTRITLVHPDHAAYSLSVPDIRLDKQLSDAHPSADSKASSQDEKRSIRVSGFSVSYCNLEPSKDTFPTELPHDSSRYSPQSPSTPRSDPDMDDTSEALMSQSLAALPPREHAQFGIDSDVDSSVLFQSALSTLPEILEERESGSNPEGAQRLHTASNTLLSLDADPLLLDISLTFPSHILPSSTSPLFQSASEFTPAPDPVQTRAVSIDVRSGILACALGPWTVSALVKLADAITSISQPNTRQSKTATPGRNRGDLSSSILHEVGVSLHVRGFVLLLLSSEGDYSLGNFFDQPLVLPTLPGSYIRLSIDTLHGDGSLSAPRNASPPTRRSSQERDPRRLDSPQSLQLNASATVSEVSLLGVFPDMTVRGSGRRVLPILITDPYLQSQYPAEHHPPISLSEAMQQRDKDGCPTLPNILHTDWLSPSMKADQAKLSHWRVKASSRHRQTQQSSAGTVIASPTSPQTTSPSVGRAYASSATRQSPAVSLHFSADSTGGNGFDSLPSTFSVDLAPLHFFIDLCAMLDTSEDGQRSSESLSFVRDITDILNRAVESKTGGNNMQYPGGDSGEREKFAQRVLDDLDLSMDYRIHDESTTTKLRTSSRKSGVPLEESPNLLTTIRMPMARFEIRSSHSDLRSCALVLDIRDAVVHLNPEVDEKSHGVASIQHLPSSEDSKPTVSAEWGRVLLAVSPPKSLIAPAFVSIGPLIQTSLFAASRAARLPRLTVCNSNDQSSSGAASIIFLDIPSVHACVTKPIFDSLQIWADDATKLMERSSAQSGAQFRMESKDPSIIGSRFFLEPQRISQDSSSRHRKSNTPANGKLVVKVLLSEMYARLQLPRLGESETRVVPFDILAAECDILLESKPQGRDELECTVAITDAAVFDRAAASPLPYFRLTHSTALSQSRPIVQIRFTSAAVAGSSAKESCTDLTLSGFTYDFTPDLRWMMALFEFVKSPPGVFEGVPPSEQTVIAAHVRDGAVRLFAPEHPGAFVIHLGELDVSTILTGDSPNLNLKIAVPSLNALFMDNLENAVHRLRDKDLRSYRGVKYWKKSYFTLVAEVLNATALIDRSTGPSTQSSVTIDGINFLLHLCADTGSALEMFFKRFGNAFRQDSMKVGDVQARSERSPENLSVKSGASQALMGSVDELAFRAMPEIGPAPDMISDDLPVNMDYLDESYGAAGGLREIDDEDLDGFGDTFTPSTDEGDPNIISRIGGETIRMLEPSLSISNNHFNTLPAIAEEIPLKGEITESFKVRRGEITIFLYEGYDLASTRQTIQHEVKEMKRRLAKIRQLVAEGQKYDPTAEETSALLFNSIYVGLEDDAADMEPEVLIAAIDEELRDDLDPETATQSSWQSLKPHQAKKAPNSVSPATRSGHHRRLNRAATPSIEIKLQEFNIMHDKYAPEEEFSSRLFATVRDAEILDHVRTSTWRKFLTALRSDSRGNIRETGSSMVRVELQTIRPVSGSSSEEARLRAKLLPLRLHVDQDALDFLKKFFMFKDHNASLAIEPATSPEAYIQRAEVFPVGIKLDYKPRRVDYRALRDGKTIELMNFFHFDGAEMTLRHIVVNGVTGWPRFFDMLNDLWTPDVKATQLAEVISGVAPIRSVVNVSSGVADLVLLPIAQYRKDGRLIRGVQKGAKAFVKSTAMEAVKLGARLATGTQVILEQTENAIGSQFNETETVMIRDDFDLDTSGDSTDEQVAEPISRYAEQPLDVQEGIQTAYASMRRNLNSAAQTILAVPMEVYERSGNEGAVRAVIRAVPIAVLKPMIGASEAVSKTLLGLQNTMDPNTRLENDAKYKRR